MYTYIYIYMYMYIYIYVYICAHMHIHIYVCVCVRACACVCVRVSVCLCVCLGVAVCVCVCVCVWCVCACFRLWVCARVAFLLHIQMNEGESVMRTRTHAHSWRGITHIMRQGTRVAICRAPAIFVLPGKTRNSKHLSTAYRVVKTTCNFCHSLFHRHPVSQLGCHENKSSKAS